MSGEQATMSEAMMQLELARKARLEAIRALEKAERDVEAELLRWREMEWSRIPPLSRKLVMPYLTAGDTINLDTVVTNKEDRKHLVKAYVGLRSAGLDGYAHYRVDGDGVCLGVKWAQKRSIDLRNFRLEYRYANQEDEDLVLYLLVHDEREELATYFATRCDVRDVVLDTSSTLLMASEYGYHEIVQTLLGRGADVHYSNYDDDDDDTALHKASRNGNIEVVRALLGAGAGADVRRINVLGYTPIYHACEGKHMEVFRALVEAGGDVNTLDAIGDTALHNASTFGLTEGVRYLVERGADVDKITFGGDDDTPLTCASFFGNVEVVRALLEAGADVNKSSTDNEYSHTPLTMASSNGKVEVVRALLEAGPDVNKRNGSGRSPLYCALEEDTRHSEERRQAKAQIAVLLREAGAQEPQQP